MAYTDGMKLLLEILIAIILHPPFDTRIEDALLRMTA
jgi:hypothetical protein